MRISTQVLSPQVLYLEAQYHLEKLGAKHAPLQRYTDTNEVYGREVTLRVPPAVYFLFGTDVGLNGNAKVMLIFLGVPDTSDTLVKGMPGWRIIGMDDLPSKRGPIRSVTLEPIDRNAAA